MKIVLMRSLLKIYLVIILLFNGLCIYSQTIVFSNSPKMKYGLKYEDMRCKRQIKHLERFLNEMVLYKKNYIDKFEEINDFVGYRDNKRRNYDEFLSLEDSISPTFKIINIVEKTNNYKLEGNYSHSYLW